MTPITELLTEKETASRLGVSPTTLRTWRCRRRYQLAFVKVGGRIRYTASAIQKFIETSTIEPGVSASRNGKRKARARNAA